MDNTSAVRESFYENYFKCYKEKDPNESFEGSTALDSSATIGYYRIGEIDDEKQMILDPAYSSLVFQNVNDVQVQPTVYMDGIRHFHIGGKCDALALDYDGNGNGFGYWPKNNTDETLYLPIVQHQRSASSDYGGTNSYVLASSQYFSTNHFQIVDEAFKNSIVDDPNNPTSYIVDGIQVFGGDCFVNIFDYKRQMVRYGLYGLMRNPNHAPNYAPAHYGESIMVPLQTEMNIALRLYRHVAKDRSYSTADGVTVYFGNGIAFDDLDAAVVPAKWEDYLYDDSYTSEQIGATFPGSPEILLNNETFYETIRYSLLKILGEKIDKYRIFKTNNKIDLNQDGGAISTIIGEKDRLYYWQQYICGYVPVGERMMAQTEVGAPVQLGIGGIYERVDDISKFFGAHSKFAVTRTEDGFVWFDVNKRIWIHMGYNQGIQKESIIKGLSKKFNTNIHNRMRSYANPVLGEGIYLLYCQSENLIYGIFSDPVDSTNDFSIAYNSLMKKFVSFFNFSAGSIKTGIVLNDELYSSNDGSKLYLHNNGDSRTFFGVKEDALVEIIVNADRKNEKAFLMGSISPISDMFDQITYKTYSQEEIEDVSLLPDNYNNRLGGKCRFNFPFTSTGRLYGLYLSLEFAETNDDDVSLVPQISDLTTFYNLWL